MDTPVWIALLVGLAGGAVLGRLARRPNRQDPAGAEVPHRARVLLSALSFPVVVARADGSVAYANSKAQDWGLSLPTRALPPSLTKVAARAVKSGGLVDADVRIRRGARSATVTVFVVAQAVPTEDLVVITGHLLESAAAGEVARREFVVNVSHELKTPIGALKLLSEATAEAADDPDQVREFASRMAGEADRLAGLAQQIVQLSRVQAAEAVFDPRPVAVAPLMAAAVKALSMHAKARRITLTATETPSASISGDAELLGMALRNLVENAILYSPDGATVTVSAAVEDGTVAIAVIDRGIGIPSYEQKRVFERFYRADAARERETGGSGLGLAIVKHVARQHGGSVDVWSRPGVGSTFTLRVPVAKGLDPAGTGAVGAT